MLKVDIRIYLDPVLSHLLDQREITGRRGCDRSLRWVETS